MPLCRLTGSDASIQQPAATRSAVGVPGRYAHAHLALPTHLKGEQNGAAPRQQRNRPATAGQHDHGLAGNRPRIERPRFSRLQASIIERQSDWGWQNSFDSKQARCEIERAAAGRAEPGLSAGKMWFGGIALALLAGGIISAVATVQSGRILPFETWARSDLMQRAGIAPGAAPRDPRVAYRVAGGEVDAALASPHQGEPADVEVALLGPILASATAAAELAADGPVPPTAARAGSDSPSERLLREPPRPVLKPTLVSSFQPQSDAPASPRSRH